MEFSIPQEVIDKAVDESIARRHLVPEETLMGRVIGIKEFNKKYVRKSPAWIKKFIFYEFKPDWVENIYPGGGNAYRIHEYAAAHWMEKHRKDIDWEGRI
ncbi:MAG TPA: hypothetical protein K8V23_05940 [Lactobacillus crispatus]|jgi:hypothetical protein|uniref:DUF771 domain-containing protein n=1 Tax=Lactobacillus crispatus TaxID=47770 RepID=A0A921FI24_9LACO|nr:hypothetical protein [Lactobacillus crispatus]